MSTTQVQHAFPSAVHLTAPFVDSTRPLPTRLPNSTLPSLSRTLHAPTAHCPRDRLRVYTDRPVTASEIDWHLPRGTNGDDDDDEGGFDDDGVHAPHSYAIHWNHSRPIHFRAFVLPYVLGLLGAMLVSCVALKTPAKATRSKVKDDDDENDERVDEYERLMNSRQQHDRFV